MYNTQSLGADLTEQILIKEMVGSPEAFFFPDVFHVGGLQRSLASRTAALRSVTKSGPLVPRTLLSRLWEQMSQAKRPAPGPTLAGAGANSAATIIKCGDSPRALLGVIRALAVKKICG